MKLAAFQDPLTECAMATKAFTEKLKRTIEAYWADHGATVEVRVVECGFSASMRCRNYAIESSLRNGLPPKQTKAVLPKKAA